MVRAQIVFMLFLLAACRKEDIGQTRSELVLVSAVLEAGSDEQKIEVSSLDKTSGLPVPMSAQVLLHAGNEIISFEENNGFYIPTEGSGMVPFNVPCTLSVTAGTREVSAVFITPGVMTVESVGPLSFAVDPESPLQDVFFAEWNAIDGYEYVLRLVCEETDPVAIPFAGAAGRFDERFKGPQLEPGFVLHAEDFMFYGAHRIEITAVDREYRDVHFFSPVSASGWVTEGPSNVEGGRGFVTAVSRLVLEITVQP